MEIIIRAPKPEESVVNYENDAERIKNFFIHSGIYKENILIQISRNCFNDYQILDSGVVVSSFKPVIEIKVELPFEDLEKMYNPIHVDVMIERSPGRPGMILRRLRDFFEFKKTNLHPAWVVSLQQCVNCVYL